MRIFWIGFFGLLGIYARYGVDQWLTKPGAVFPLSTFIINLSGSFFAGVLFGLGTERGWLSPDLRIGLMVGLLGGFTTFSAYALQSALAIKNGEIGWGVSYLVLSPVLGLILAFAGMATARAL